MKLCKTYSEHHWITDTALLLSDPPQIREICLKCGEKRTLPVYTYTKFNEPTYQEVEERFRKLAESPEQGPGIVEDGERK